MVVLITERNCLEGWRCGCARIAAGHGELEHIITTILDPCADDPHAFGNFDPDIFGQSDDTVAHVARTIFPSGIWRLSTDRDDLYQRYRRALARTRRSGWGTYFDRLINFGGTPQKRGTNQLERIIQNVAGWRGNYKAAFIMHISAPHLDKPVPRGGPCLQYLQLVGSTEGRYDLVVLYRNHDYFNKTLGNFVGLGQLLKFICDESGKKPGSLICHSVHAFVGTGGNIRLLRRLANV